MKPEIVTAFDTETGATDVLVNSVTCLRVNADGTIDAFGGVTGDILRSEAFPIRTAEYNAWVQAEADKIPALNFA